MGKNIKLPKIPTPKVRRKWKLDPTTKIHKDKTSKNRSKEKQKWSDELEQDLKEQETFGC